MNSAARNSQTDKKEDKIETVSGRVLWIDRKKKDRNKLFIGSQKFGTMIVKATLSDKDADGIKLNDEIQLSGKMRLRKWIASDDEVVRDVLVMTPVVQHIFRTTSFIKRNQET